MEALTGKRIRPLTRLPQEWPRSEPGSHEESIAALNQVLDSIRRYRSFIVRMIILGAILAVLGTLFVSPTYKGIAQLAVSTRGTGAADAFGAAGTTAGSTTASEESTIDTHVTVLSSDGYLRRLLPKLQTPDSADHDPAMDVATWTKRAQTYVRTAWSKAKELVSNRTQPSDGMVIAGLKGSLKVSQERRSRIISVIVTDANPKHAAKIANIVAQSYVEELIRQRQAIQMQALAAIATQSSQVQRDLSQAKDDLDAARSSQAPLSQRAAIEWQMTTLSQQLETLLRRRQELITKGLVNEPDVTLLSEALPPDSPTSLSAFLFVPPITIAFGLLACLIAIIRNRFDRTLHTEAEAAEALGIPCLGLVPLASFQPTRQPGRTLQQPAIAYTRAIRSTVISLLASESVDLCSRSIILVTSSSSGEGKSAVSWGVSLYAAQVGQRVLYVDFGQSARRRGGDTEDMFNALAQDHSIANAIQRIEEIGIDYLAAGYSEKGRLRTLANPKLSLLFEQLRGMYDLVVIDTPSMQDAPEVRLLARWADHVLFVVGAGSTRRDLAKSTLQQFARTRDVDRDVHLWSVLTSRHTSIPDPSGQEQSSGSTLMKRYQQLKAVVIG